MGRVWFARLQQRASNVQFLQSRSLETIDRGAVGAWKRQREESERISCCLGRKERERERYRYREIEKAERYTPPNSDENPLNIEPGTSGSSMVICSWLTPFHALLEGGLYHKVSSVFD